jgi:Transglutaminase-like superfamily/Coenzyme PQQ synthesis protein D (PqqD)
MASYIASSAIRHRVIDGNVVILDLRSGEYKILDEVATMMWRAALEGVDRPACVESIAEQFAAAPAEVATDFDRFLADAEAAGLLSSRQNAAGAAPVLTRRWPQSFLVVAAWWSLFRTTRLLSTNGFAHVYASLGAYAKPRVRTAELPERLAHVERAFSFAENFFVLSSAPKDCLPRSLSLYRFLLSAGVSANHVIGVRRFPFQAHAWVECEGKPLFDSPDHTGCYSELARL